MFAIDRGATYSIAGDNDKLIQVRLDDGLGGIRVAGYKILHVAVSKSSGHGQDPVHSIVEDQTASVGDTLPFILVASLVVVR